MDSRCMQFFGLSLAYLLLIFYLSYTYFTLSLLIWDIYKRTSASGDPNCASQWFKDLMTYKIKLALNFL